MAIIGIDSVTYGVADLQACKRYFLDWGLSLVRDGDDEVEFACMNDSRVRLLPSESPNLPAAIEGGPTVREVVWGVDSIDDVAAIASSLSQIARVRQDEASLSATDPNGLTVGFRVSTKKDVVVPPTFYNTWNSIARVDAPSPVYERAIPVDIGHVVFFTEQLKDVEEWYTRGVGFQVTDRYPDRGIFMRCSIHGGHHDIFFLQLPHRKRGLNHVAFTVRDIHEVFGGGLHVSRAGWQTEIGPGRHPISSAYFWYFKCPAGGATEYSADEDFCSPKWQPREFEPTPKNYAEWAARGDIDMRSRRPNAAASDAVPRVVSAKAAS